MLILVVEDDPSYAEIISHTLRRDSHEVVAVGSAADAASFAKRKLPDLAVLDVSLPDGTGMQVCDSLRELNPAMPIVMLSSLDRSVDIVAGLEAGADDYLTKPFHPSELLARVNAVARRGTTITKEQTSTARITAHGFDVDPSNQAAHFNGVSLKLTRIEVEILAQLIRYPGQALTHAFLTEVIWGYKNVPDATLLKGHVSSIRRKVRDAGGTQDMIRTVHGVGYSFNP